VFSETRYALNGDLRVAYRASREGARDIVFVPPWITNCEVFPELPSIRGWVETMTSLGRLIFFDQPGTGHLAKPVHRWVRQRLLVCGLFQDATSRYPISETSQSQLRRYSSRPIWKK
jgi:hypothetical protein